MMTGLHRVPPMPGGWLVFALAVLALFAVARPAAAAKGDILVTYVAYFPDPTMRDGQACNAPGVGEAWKPGIYRMLLRSVRPGSATTLAALGIQFQGSEPPTVVSWASRAPVKLAANGSVVTDLDGLLTRFLDTSEANWKTLLGLLCAEEIYTQTDDGEALIRLARVFDISALNPADMAFVVALLEADPLIAQSPEPGKLLQQWLDGPAWEIGTGFWGLKALRNNGSFNTLLDHFSKQAFYLSTFESAHPRLSLNLSKREKIRSEASGVDSTPVSAGPPPTLPTVSGVSVAGREQALPGAPPTTMVAPTPAGKADGTWRWGVALSVIAIGLSLISLMAVGWSYLARRPTTRPDLEGRPLAPADRRPHGWSDEARWPSPPSPHPVDDSKLRMLEERLSTLDRARLELMGEMGRTREALAELQDEVRALAKPVSWDTSTLSTGLDQGEITADRSQDVSGFLDRQTDRNGTLLPPSPLSASPQQVQPEADTQFPTARGTSDVRSVAQGGVSALEVAKDRLTKVAQGFSLPRETVLELSTVTSVNGVVDWLMRHLLAPGMSVAHYASVAKELRRVRFPWSIILPDPDEALDAKRHEPVEYHARTGVAGLILEVVQPGLVRQDGSVILKARVHISH